MKRPATRTLLTAGTIALIAGGLVTYATFDPAATQWMPRCLFHTLTGWQCPGCGSQRMLHALLTGHPLEAIRHNALLFTSLPLILLILWSELPRQRRLHPHLHNRLHHPRTILTALIIIILWWIIRNITGI